MHASIKAALVAAAFTSLGLVGAPGASATTQHCNTTDYPNKVETPGAGTSVDTGLAPGTTVCIKAGTQVTTVTVASDGSITNTTIRNPNGRTHPLLGISYYAYGDECVPNPSLGEYCGEEPPPSQPS